MRQKIYILAKPGLVVPLEGVRRRVPCGDPKKDAASAIKVTTTRYYKRMLRDGAVVEVPEDQVEKALAARNKKRAAAAEAAKKPESANKK